MYIYIYILEKAMAPHSSTLAWIHIYIHIYMYMCIYIPKYKEIRDKSTSFYLSLAEKI